MMGLYIDGIPINFHGADHVISSELFPEVYPGDLPLWNLSGITTIFKLKTSITLIYKLFFRIAMVIKIPPSLFKR